MADGWPLFLIFLKALIDEILEIARPALIIDLSMIIIANSLVQFPASKFMERRITSSELKCVTAIAPHINLFTVKLTAVDFRTHPVKSSTPSLPLLFFFGKIFAET